jgi:septum site-determining protein MinD
MTEIVVVTSGKGGVGKTTTSASFSTGLAMRGKKTCVIDFDIGLRNLDLVMGVERRVIYDIINVINGEANLNQALIKDKTTDNLYILAASQTRDKEALTSEGVGKIIDQLKADGFDYIICDSPAGIESGAIHAMYYATKALVVTNPEVSSVRDSDRIIGMLASKTKQAIDGGMPIKEYLVITRYSDKRVSKGEMLSVDDIQELLRIDLLAIIPESSAVLSASNSGVAVVKDQSSDAGKAYNQMIDRFLSGESGKSLYPAKKKGFFAKMFGAKQGVEA